MKTKYIQIVVEEFLSNNRLNMYGKNYDLVTTVVHNTGSGEEIVYIFKKKNFFSRLINKIF
jgi:hypothetical protein